jgi:hypothetical protein
MSHKQWQEKSGTAEAKALFALNMGTPFRVPGSLRTLWGGGHGQAAGIGKIGEMNLATSEALALPGRA